MEKIRIYYNYPVVIVYMIVLVFKHLKADEVSTIDFRSFVAAILDDVSTVFDNSFRFDLISTLLYIVVLWRILY